MTRIVPPLLVLLGVLSVAEPSGAATPRLGADLGLGGLQLGTLGLVFEPYVSWVQLRAGLGYNGETPLAMGSVVLLPVDIFASASSQTSLLAMGTAGHAFGETSGRLVSRADLSVVTLDYGGAGAGVQVAGEKAALYADVTVLWFAARVTSPAQGVDATATGWIAPIPQFGTILYF